MISGSMDKPKAFKVFVGLNSGHESREEQEQTTTFVVSQPPANQLQPTSTSGKPPANQPQATSTSGQPKTLEDKEGFCTF
jgi:hypothetical protein